MVNRPTFGVLPRGARVYSNPETEAIIRTMHNPGYDSPDLVRALERNNEKLIRAIENKRELTIIPEKGRITERKGNYFKTYLNSKITG